MREQVWTRRRFLAGMGSAVPTAEMLFNTASASPDSSSNPRRAKFVPLDLSPYFTACLYDLKTNENTTIAEDFKWFPGENSSLHLPSELQRLHGIPFQFGDKSQLQRSLIVVSTHSAKWTSSRGVVKVDDLNANFVCMAHFCNWDRNEAPEPSRDVIERVGQLLAEIELHYTDGSRHVAPIRRRFEVNSPFFRWGHLSFASRPYFQDAPLKLTAPLRNAMTEWGDLQTGLWNDSFSGEPKRPDWSTFWICAIRNPFPEKQIRSLVVVSKAADPLVICAMTLFCGKDNPLQLQKLSLYRLTLPEATAHEEGKWKVTTDLGIIARTYSLGEFTPTAWLTSEVLGLGEREQRPPSRRLYVELTASPDATLWLENARNRQRFEVELNRISPGSVVKFSPAGAEIEILEASKTWLHGSVIDQSTQRPTPVRLAFRTPTGRYLPPYGHRNEINRGWFQDYGADLKIQDTSYAYVDGTFQVELPVGDVYLEITKGFEYEPVRQKLDIKPGQRELKVEISRFSNLRERGWASADTHVHFLSPSTAVLEGQCEDLNLINLLAAQWGDLFTNVGDLPHGPLQSADGSMLVKVGTENRQHLLGHLGLLGTKGNPVFPMSAAGPDESYLGDPLWSSLSEWADACRARDGLVVAVHFPYPTAELTADILLGKIDALELQPREMNEHFNSLRFLEWYRYLNCGYKLPAVGGTDKMSASIPAGAIRTYAYIKENEFSFDRWAAAVRRGNTFMSSGPLLRFQVEGQEPGAQIQVNSGGGDVEFLLEAECFVPFHRLEVVLNGRVVAAREASDGTRKLTLRDKTKIERSGWLAGRCASKLTSAGSFKVAAHTSPVYLQVGSDQPFSESAAAYFLTLLDGSESWVRTLATPPDQERLTRILKVFSDARDLLHHRMHQHRIPH